MTSVKSLLTVSAAAGALLVGLQPALAVTGNPHVESATAVTQVFGAGQKLVAVALKYDSVIDGAELSPTSFSADGRTVTGVFASTSADPADQAAQGRYVIVALSPDDAAAALMNAAGRGPGGPGGPSAGRRGAGGHRMGGGEPSFKPAKATVTQTGTVHTAGGQAYAPGAAPISTSLVDNLIVDEFRQYAFHDPKTGDTLKYNLFVPKGYNGTKSYPMVLFMHDAGVLGSDPLITLRQGLGAVVWASPADQAKHPSFVLAPQYDSSAIDNGARASNSIDTTVDLVRYIAGKYNIDQSRLYTTGQSLGAMMSIAMDIKYPHLFAASFIVAGQWDASLVAPLAKEKLWILVSQGDMRAFPGENEITAALEKRGAKITHEVWSGLSTPAQFAADVAAVEAHDTPINYTPLLKGTVVPAGQYDNSLANHLNTWRIAYTIEGIRDWLFQQHK